MLTEERVKLAYGLLPDGRMIHVSHVERGLACNATCPGCGARLRAHKGRIEHHFHHDTGSDCGTGRETALHLIAKDVLASELKLHLPEYVARDGYRMEVVSDRMCMVFDTAHVEESFGNFVPDIVLVKSGHELVVEIAVTHRCDEAKIEIFRASETSAVEVDLSHLPYDAAIETVRAAVLQAAPRQWLHNPLLEKSAARVVQKWHEERERDKKGNAKPFARTVSGIMRAPKLGQGRL